MLKSMLSKMKIFHKIMLTFFILNTMPLIMLIIINIYYIKKDYIYPFNIFFIAIVTFFFASLIIGAYLAESIMSPIRKLRDNCNEIANSKKYTPIPVYHKDELGELTIAFNRMLETIKDNVQHRENGSKSSSITEQSATKKTIAIIDDSDSIKILWRLTLENHNTLEFSTPEEFFKAVEENSHFLDSLYCVIIDLYFHPLSEIKGFEVSSFIKERCAHIPVLLSTNGDVTKAELEACRADKIISKNPIDFANLKKIIDKA